jgi:hypothetical protein
MRCGIILAAALSLMSATAAHADKWCGYAAHAKSLVECGYSSATECENAIGKGGMCFIDPDYALNSNQSKSAQTKSAIATPVMYSTKRD